MTTVTQQPLLRDSFALFFGFSLTTHKAPPRTTRGRAGGKPDRSRHRVLTGEVQHRALAVALRAVQVGVHAGIAVHTQPGSLGRVLKVRGHGVRRRPPVGPVGRLFGIPVGADLREGSSRPRKRGLLTLVSRSGRRQHPVGRFQRTQEELLHFGAAANGGSGEAVGFDDGSILPRLPTLNDLPHIRHAVAHVPGVPEGESGAASQVVRHQGVRAHRADERAVAPESHSPVERLRQQQVAAGEIAARPDLHGVALEGAEQRLTPAQGSGGIDLDGIDRAELIAQVEEVAHADRAVLMGVQAQDRVIVAADDGLVAVGLHRSPGREVHGQVGGRDDLPRRDDLPCLGGRGVGVESLREAVPCAGLVHGDGVGRFDQVSHDAFPCPRGAVEVMQGL